VDERELKVGLRVHNSGGTVHGQIFISDSLENGAGYSSLLGQPAEMEALLESVAGQGADLRYHAPLVDPLHASNCQTSCPDCVRDFSNLAFHNILDWRLGIDMARLALDPQAPVDFTVSYWQALVPHVTRDYFANQPGWSLVSSAPVPVGRSGNDTELVTHPLWTASSLHPHLHAAGQHWLTATGRRSRYRSFFEILRRPY
jgi:DEAD/DEAH box helicase domain-containing protein